MNEGKSVGRVAFVTGGSGFVGGKLIGALRGRGWEVRALARSKEAEVAVSNRGATPVHGDLSDRQVLQAGLIGVDVIFHVAAHFKMWGPRSDFDRVNVDGIKNIIESAIAIPSIRKLVAVSAAAVVMGGPKPFLEIDETVPRQARAFAPYSSSKAEAEKILLVANGRRAGFETVAIRPPMIWGPGMPMLDHMVQVVKAGQWQWVEKGTQAMSTCHVDNLVEGMLLAAEHGRGGEAYFIADAEVGTLKSVIGGLLATKNVKATDKAVSFTMAWRLAGLMGFFWRLLRLKSEPPITRQMLQLIGKPFTVSIDKARRELTYTPKITWSRGISDMSDRQSAALLV
ncbi:MAG: NAD-dependent epimerase/dehydratase family protein [Hyphomicrobium sp.]